VKNRHVACPKAPSRVNETFAHAHRRATYVPRSFTCSPFSNPSWSRTSSYTSLNPHSRLSYHMYSPQYTLVFATFDFGAALLTCLPRYLSHINIEVLIQYNRVIVLHETWLDLHRSLVQKFD
jgi:hypothetical protein